MSKLRRKQNSLNSQVTPYEIVARFQITVGKEEAMRGTWELGGEKKGVCAERCVIEYEWWRII